MSSDGKAADISAGTRAWASFIVCHLHVDLEAAAGGGTDRHCASDRKSTRLNSSHSGESRMPSSA